MAEPERGRRRERGDRGERERSERKRGTGAERRRKPKRAAAGMGEEHLPIGRANLVLFGVALGVIVLGFIVLARGSITLAPLLLVLGYCVLVPLAIVYRSRRRGEAAGGAELAPRAESGTRGE